MKITRHKNIFGLIYMALLAVPFVSILARVIYVQSNKNAFESYSGETQDDVQYKALTNISQFKQGQLYQFNYIQNTYTNFSNGKSLYFTDYYSSQPNLNFNFTPTNIYMFNSSNRLQIQFKDDDGNINQLSGASYTFNFQFKLTTFSGNAPDSIIFDFVTKIIYPSNNYLDNVFEYSIDSIIKENNLGRINFMGWFTDLFLNDNEVNNRYVGYANWYMNYVMFISCAYLLFLVLMWFINFARRLLERGMNYDF